MVKITYTWETGDDVGRDSLGVSETIRVLSSLPLGTIVRDGSGEKHRKDVDGWRITIDHYASTTEQMAHYISPLTIESIGDGAPIGEIFDKMMGDYDSYHLSADEATMVWREVYELFMTYPDRKGGMLSVLFNKIERECTNGERCSVCGSYKDPACIEGC